MSKYSRKTYCLHCRELAVTDKMGQYYHCTSPSCGASFPIPKEPKPEPKPETTAPAETNEA